LRLISSHERRSNNVKDLPTTKRPRRAETSHHRPVRVWAGSAGGGSAGACVVVEGLEVFDLHGLA
jgi:hypothetical protein